MSFQYMERVMSLFTPLVGSVVLRSRGEYQQATLAECESVVFAKLAGKYFRLNKDGSTSATGFHWGPIDLIQPKDYDALGKMILVKKIAA